MNNPYSYVNRKLLNFLIGQKNYDEIKYKINILNDPDRVFFSERSDNSNPEAFVPKNRQECYQCLAWTFGQIMKVNLHQDVDKQFFVGISGGFIREYIIRDQAPNDIDFKIGIPRSRMVNKDFREHVIDMVKVYLPDMLKQHWPRACETNIPGSRRKFFEIYEEHSMKEGIGLSILFFVHPKEGEETHGRPAEDVTDPKMRVDNALLFHCDGNSVDAFDSYNEFPYVPSSSDNFKLVVDKKTRQYELKLSINVNLPPWPSLAIAIALNLRQQTVFYYDVQEWVNDSKKSCRSKAPKLYELLDDGECINNPESKCDYIRIVRGWEDAEEQKKCRSRVIERLNRTIDRNFYIITGYQTDNTAQNVADGRGDKSLINSSFYNQEKRMRQILEEWTKAKESRNVQTLKDTGWQAILFRLKNTTEIPWGKLAMRLHNKVVAGIELKDYTHAALIIGINPYFWFSNYYCNLIKLDGPSIPGKRADPQQQENYCKILDSLLIEEAFRLINAKTQYDPVEGAKFDVPISPKVGVGMYIKYKSAPRTRGREAPIWPTGTTAKITGKTPDGKRFITDGGPMIKPSDQDYTWELEAMQPVPGPDDRGGKQKKKKFGNEEDTRDYPVRIGTLIQYKESPGWIAKVIRDSGNAWQTDGGPYIKKREKNITWRVAPASLAEKYYNPEQKKKTLKKNPKVGSIIRYLSKGTTAKIIGKTPDGKRFITDGGPMIKPWKQGEEWNIVKYGGGLIKKSNKLKKIKKNKNITRKNRLKQTKGVRSKSSKKK